MAKRRAGSINYQVSLIIKAHNGIKVSKLQRRNESGIKSLESGHKVSDLFHSYKSLDNVRNDLRNLGYFAKEEFKIKKMAEIDKEVIKEWIKSKDITYNTASNYLSEINKVSEHLNISREEVKELRAELKKELKENKLDTRAYKKLDKITLPPKAQVVFELQRDYGLRVAAAKYIDIEKQIQNNTFFYKEKGGKISSKEISDTLIKKIKENAVNGKFELSYNTYRDQLKKAIESTGQKYTGTHGLRHSFAQRKLEEGYSKAQVSEMMGHSREEITNTYIR